MLSDLDLIDRIKKEACNQSMIELCERHRPICFGVLRRYEKRLEHHPDFEELKNEIDYMIFSCAASFNPEKGSKFSTWLANNFKYKCLNCLCNKKNKIIWGVNEYKEDLSNGTDEYFFEEKLKYYKELIFNELNRHSDHRLEKVIYLRYFGDKESRKWKNISKVMKTTHQTAITLHHKAIKFLKKNPELNKALKKLDKTN